MRVPLFRPLLPLVVLLGITTVACLPHPTGNNVPIDKTMGGRCRLGSSQTGLLITEWSGAEKANLETLVQEGAVPVAFKGCSLKIISQCKLGGRYAWHRTAVTSDAIEIRNTTDLYTKFPLGIVSLSAELKRNRLLRVRTTVSGQHRLAEFTAAQVPQSAECSTATHIIRAISVGAFALEAENGQKIGGRVDLKQVGVGASHGTAKRLVKSAGDMALCTQATNELPHIDCGSPIQVFLEPIFGKAEEEGPPGSLQVDFVSANPNTRWDVYLNDEATCTTPCTKWVEPHRPIIMQSRSASFGMSTDKLRIGQLNEYQGPLQITAKKTSLGMLATGITFTTFGGIALLAGIPLTAVGCTKGTGMCTSGIITGLAGLAGIGGSIWLMIDAQEKAYIRPLYEGETTVISASPTGIHGHF